VSSPLSGHDGTQLVDSRSRKTPPQPRLRRVLRVLRPERGEQERKDRIKTFSVGCSDFNITTLCTFEFYPRRSMDFFEFTRTWQKIKIRRISPPVFSFYSQIWSIYMYRIQHCFTYCPSDSVSKDGKIEYKT
jgi:hypothetical protein